MPVDLRNATHITVRKRLLMAREQHPKASHAELARIVGTAHSYVGKVLGPVGHHGGGRPRQIEITPEMQDVLREGIREGWSASRFESRLGISQHTLACALLDLLREGQS